MNALGFLVLIVCGILILRLPRRYAPFPLLLGSLYMTNGQMVEIGPLNFTVMRLLLLAGFARVIIRSERIIGPLNWVDRSMVLWAGVAIISSIFHKDVVQALVFRCGFAYNALGSYLLLRIFVKDKEDVLRLVRTVLILVIPLAAEMVSEKLTGKNLFYYLGGIYELEVRAGRIRAQGPFGHSILAGTAGAVCVPLALIIWKTHFRLALAGLIGSLAMIFASASSGPVLTLLATVGALFLWRARSYLRVLRLATVFGILALSLVMNGPVYSLISRIDLTGSSTGWHRQALIDASIRHFHEWWFAGTDYTRHWMPTGILANPDHTDITNVYIMMGVIGGLPMMALFIISLVNGFRLVGRILEQTRDTPQDAFLAWALGAILFGHTVTFISVDYFDQTSVLYYLVLAAIGCTYSAIMLNSSEYSQVPVDSTEEGAVSSQIAQA